MSLGTCRYIYVRTKYLGPGIYYHSLGSWLQGTIVLNLNVKTVAIFLDTVYTVILGIFLEFFVYFEYRNIEYQNIEVSRPANKRVRSKNILLTFWENEWVEKNGSVVELHTKSYIIA